jgi:antitoxin (DNA-binding transcriptional repressor) of toxin-antitoxin stability system
MNVFITAKRLQALLPRVVARLKRGVHFTVVYRGRTVFHIVPVDTTGRSPIDFANDAPYRAPAVGRSRDGRTAAEHDTVLHRS